MKIPTTPIISIKSFLKSNLSEITPKKGWKISEIPAIIENTSPDCAPFR